MQKIEIPLLIWDAVSVVATLAVLDWSKQWLISRKLSKAERRLKSLSFYKPQEVVVQAVRDMLDWVPKGSKIRVEGVEGRVDIRMWGPNDEMPERRP